MAHSLTELVALPDLTAAGDSNAPSGSWPYNTTGSSTSGGTWTSLPIPVSGNTTSTGNGNVTTSTGNGNASSGSTGGAIGNLANALNTISAMKAKKDNLRIVIQKTDGTQLLLEEQTIVTPQEMIGLSKFFTLMSCATAVFTQAGSGYNIDIIWSEIIKNLSIERHFVHAAAASVVPTNVLVITLFDPT